MFKIKYKYLKTEGNLIWFEQLETGLVYWVRFVNKL